MYNIDNYIKRVGKTCYTYRLLEPDDRILVGLSGGKDSLFLIEALAELKRHLNFHIEILVCHVHVHNIGYQVDIGFLQNYCKQFDVPLFIEEISIDLEANPNKSRCFVCSRIY